MNGNNTEPLDSYELKKYKDEQALHIIVGLLERTQANIKLYIGFLEKILATQNKKPEKQTEDINEILDDDGDFINKQLEQIRNNMHQLENNSESPDLWTYSIEIAKVQDSLERLIPINKKKSDNANKGDLEEYLSYEEFDPSHLSHREFHLKTESHKEFESSYPLIPKKNASSTELVETYKHVRTNLERAKKIRREIGIFTIPLRVKEYMKKLAGVGTYLDFHNQFKNELEDADDRMVVLRKLAEWNSKYIHGVVDIDKGVIYYVGNFWRQVLSYIMILGTAVIGLGIVYLFKFEGFQFLGFKQNPDDYWILFVLYLLTFTGVFLHIIKQAGDLSRMKDNKGVILDKLRLWVHVREYRFVTTVIAAIVGFILLAHYTDMYEYTSEIYWTFFLVGYSVDSFSDLLLQRFNTAVSVHNQDVKNKLSNILKSSDQSKSLSLETIKETSSK